MGGAVEHSHRVGRAFAAGVVWLRYVVVLAWAAAAVAAALFLPSLADVSSDAGGLVKEDATAIAAQQRSAELFGYPLLTEVALVQRLPTGLAPDALSRVADRAKRITVDGATAKSGLLAAIPVVNVEGAMSTRHEKSTTAVTYLYFDPALTFERRVALAHDVIRSDPRAAGDGAIGVTGVVPARVEQAAAILDALPAITVATLLLILLVVGIWQRSVLAPVITLVAAGVAYVVGIGVVAWFGRATGLELAQEVEPLILVLVLGIVTDYCVFLLAATRRGIAEGLDPREAVRAATVVTAPTILTAGLIVAGGTASLTLGKLGFFQALGPALALAAAIGTLVALTLVPAALAIVAGWMFRRVEASAEPAAAVDEDGEVRPSNVRSIRARLARSRVVALPLALLCIIGLGYAANDVREARIGFSLTGGAGSDSEVRRAADAARLGFSAGIISPTEIILDGPKIAADTAALRRAEDLLRRTPGVTGVVGPAEQAAVDDAATATARVLGATKPRPFVTESGSAVRMLVVLRDDPFSSGAIATVERLRKALPGLVRQAGLDVTGVAIAGQTALAEETVQESKTDIVRLALAALAVNLVFLMLFLRAIVAPIVLLAASVLALGAALGVTVIVSRVLGWGDVAYYTPLAAAVLLLSLGSDYNVFVVGRIWQEAARRSLADAVAIAVPAAAKPVTLAGIVLAGSFALLALAPVVALRQLAVCLSTGVLIDAFIVRSLLVPSLITSLGPIAGWPGKALRDRAGDDAERPASVPLAAGAED
jgi:RND superfamily putative drug exporter